ncbi:hypothetical protein QP028_14355 [Corynebacterium suedekumii]|nr:hypothetical protein QP028_14355 [Corynebacterium suedekumii]
MSRTGYVLKMYPRFSETFVVSEILAREAAGEDIVIFSLRPCTDARFHPELARVEGPGHPRRPAAQREHPVVPAHPRGRAGPVRTARS